MELAIYVGSLLVVLGLYIARPYGFVAPGAVVPPAERKALPWVKA